MRIGLLPNHLFSLDPNLKEFKNKNFTIEKYNQIFNNNKKNNIINIESNYEKRIKITI